MPPSLAGTPPLTRPPNRPTNCARSSPLGRPASRRRRRFGPGGSIGRTVLGCQGRTGATRAAGGHTPAPGTVADQCRDPAVTPHYTARATRCRDSGNGYPHRRVVRWGRPESEAGEELLDNLGLLDEGFVVSSAERR
jgi:hypothetical protein